LKINVGRTYQFILIVLGITFLVAGVGVNSEKVYLISNTPNQMSFPELNKYRTSQAPLIIESDNDLISLNLEGSGTFDDPFLLQQMDFTSDVSHLIEVSDVSLHLTIQGNFLNGVTGQYDGIVLQRVSNVIIRANNIVQTNIGIQLNSSSSNIIGNNTISSNTGYAIELIGESNLNLIVWNNILQSSPTTANAYDEGLQNVFQNNYWEDQAKQDENGDQINDHQYNIDGNMTNSDLTPLINEFASSTDLHSNIHLLQPNPSELRISLDLAGHSVEYSIFYSNDSMKSWILIEDQLEVNYYNWNISEFDDGQYHLKVQVIDEIEFTTEFIFDSAFYVGKFGSDDNASGSGELYSSVQGFGFMGLLLFIVISIVYGSYQFLKSVSNRSLTIKVLEGLLGVAATPVLLQIISDDAEEIDDYELFPPELLKFKFLLNPVRLGILKILYDYTQIAAYELRDLIGISWGKFTPHIDSLINKGLISSSSDFIQGKPRKIIYIEERGRARFMELQIILQKIAN
jgi:parallel beta-helix repeat protein